MISRGDLYSACLDPVVGSEQGGIRPVLVIQNDVGNRHSPTVIVLAVTGQLGKARLPTHVPIACEGTGLVKDSVVLAEQIRTLDKRRLRERIGSALTAEGARLCVIPENDAEYLCYEISATDGTGSFLVYIDAMTGVERELMQVVDDGGGSFVM